MAKLGKILMIVGAAVIFIFLAASTGGNAWVVSKIDSDYQSGLWKSCSPNCRTIDILEDWFKATRAFSIMATLAAVAATLLAILGMVSEKIKTLFASLFLFGAAFCMMIALSIYTAETDISSSAEYGWSYIIGWIGTVGAVAVGVLGFFADKF